MRDTLTLNAALANTGNSHASDDLLSFLQDKMSGVEFKKRISPPGVVMSDAFDWRAVIGTTASLLCIAQTLWAAYKKFIVPARAKGKDNAFLVVEVHSEERECAMFSVGEEYQDEKSFTTAFSEKIQRISVTTSVEKD